MELEARQEINAVAHFEHFFNDTSVVQNIIDFGRTKKAAVSVLSQYDRQLACNDYEEAQILGIIGNYFIKKAT